MNLVEMQAAMFDEPFGKSERHGMHPAAVGALGPLAAAASAPRGQAGNAYGSTVAGGLAGLPGYAYAFHSLNRNENKMLRGDRMKGGKFAKKPLIGIGAGVAGQMAGSSYMYSRHKKKHAAAYRGE